MKITLENIGKRFNSQWIFRKMNMELSEGKGYAILGANGSGKSTLLQVIAGNQLPSEGKINYFNGKTIDPDEFYSYISIAAPYLELIEEFSLAEQIRFHSHFKKFRNALTAAEIPDLCSLSDSRKKQIRDFSSGMKQRLKLALAILSDTTVLLLDEPCSNLDAEGVNWYNKMIEENRSGRIVIVCSNQQKNEYGFCDQEIKVEDHK